MAMFLVLLFLAATTFLNILVPLSGSAIVTPILTLFVDPHTAIGLASIAFLLSGIVRASLFWKSIMWNEVQMLIIPSIVASALGALTIGSLPTKYLFLVLFLATAFFFLKKLGLLHTRTPASTVELQGIATGFASGYLQGSGIAGSDLRNAYLMANNLTINALHGTTSVLGFAVFATATLVRLQTHQLEISSVMYMMILLPFIIIATLLGKKLC